MEQKAVVGTAACFDPEPWARLRQNWQISQQIENPPEHIQRLTMNCSIVNPEHVLLPRLDGLTVERRSDIGGQLKRVVFPGRRHEFKIPAAFNEVNNATMIASFRMSK